jgi:hypothetical protein
MRSEENWDVETMDLSELMTRGRDQVGNLTFYKLVFNALDQLARENAADDETYRRALVGLVSGFLSAVQPRYLPQAVAAKNLLLKKAVF